MTAAARAEAPTTSAINDGAKAALIATRAMAGLQIEQGALGTLSREAFEIAAILRAAAEITAEAGLHGDTAETLFRAELAAAEDRRNAG